MVLWHGVSLCSDVAGLCLPLAFFLKMPNFSSSLCCTSIQDTITLCNGDWRVLTVGLQSGWHSVVFTHPLSFFCIPSLVAGQVQLSSFNILQYKHSTPLICIMLSIHAFQSFCYDVFGLSLCWPCVDVVAYLCASCWDLGGSYAWSVAKSPERGWWILELAVDEAWCRLQASSFWKHKRSMFWSPTLFPYKTWAIDDPCPCWPAEMPKSDTEFQRRNCAR